MSAETSECWCGEEPHDDRCDQAPMEPMTKRRFVEYLETAATHGIESFRFLADDGLSYPVDELMAMAVEEVAESAACYAGIGSCGGGGCKHS